jgi:hypothetical protein
MPFVKNHIVNLGRKHTPENREKMSNAHKGLKPSLWGAGFKKGNVPWNLGRKIAINSYYAGLIDGEGMITTYRNGLNEKYRSVLVAISLCKGSEILWEGQKIWGGKVHKRTSRGLNHSDITEWRLYSNQAGKFLKDILPFLKIKKEQAEIVLRLRFLQTRKRNGTNIIPDKEISYRKELTDKLKSLHKFYSD